MKTSVKASKSKIYPARARTRREKHLQKRNLGLNTSSSWPLHGQAGEQCLQNHWPTKQASTCTYHVSPKLIIGISCSLLAASSHVGCLSCMLFGLRLPRQGRVHLAQGHCSSCLLFDVRSPSQGCVPSVSRLPRHLACGQFHLFHQPAQEHLGDPFIWLEAALLLAWEFMRTLGEGSLPSFLQGGKDLRFFYLGIYKGSCKGAAHFLYSCKDQSKFPDGI